MQEQIVEKLALQHQQASVILTNLQQLQATYALTSKTLRYSHVNNLYNKLHNYLGIFAEKIHHSWAEFKAITMQAQKISFEEGEPTLHKLEQLISELADIVRDTQHLINYQVKLQNYIKLTITPREKIFFNCLNKKIKQLSVKQKISLHFDKELAKHIARILTLHYTSLLHSIAEEDINAFSEEIACKFENYLCLNEAKFLERDLSRISDESWIEISMLGKASSGLFANGQTLKLVSGKSINSEALILEKQKKSLQLGDLAPEYINLQECGAEAFKKTLLTHLTGIDEKLARVYLNIILLKAEVSRLMPTQTDASEKIDRLPIDISKNYQYRTSRTELETYASLHRLDDASARGSFHDYIWKLHYSQPSGYSLLLIDAQNLDLSSANFIKADFSHCNFSGSNLSYASFYQANLMHANLANTNLDHAILDQAILSKNSKIANKLSRLKSEIKDQSESIQKNIKNLKPQEALPLYFQLIKTIQIFFGEALLSPNGEKLKTTATSICKIYLDAVPIYLKLLLNSNMNSLTKLELLVREFITITHNDLEQWKDLVNINEHIIDLTSIQLDRMNLADLDFFYILVTSDQLANIDGIRRIRHVEPEKLQAAYNIKFQNACSFLQRALQTVDMCGLAISALQYIKKFACWGNMPQLASIPDNELKLCVLLLLRSTINLLPDEHSQCQYNMMISADNAFMNLPRSEVEENLENLLNARNYALATDVIALTFSRKLAIIYNAIGDTFIEIADVEKMCLSDLNPDQAYEITQKMDTLKQLRRKYRDEEKANLLKADQLIVDTLLDNLHSPSPHEGFTPEIRLEMVEQVRRSNEQIIVNLKTLSRLTPEVIEILDITSPRVLLTLAQHKNILSKIQQQKRNDAFQADIKKNDFNAVNAWLKAGIDINASARDGRTALMDACFYGHVAIVKLLLDNGADPHIVSARNISIIDGICLLDKMTENHIAIIKLLQEYGVVPNFHNLIAMGDILAVQEAYKKGGININQSLRGDTPLHIAAQLGHVEITAWLLMQGADPLLPNFEEQLPLAIACKYGHTEIARLLLTMDLANLKDRQDRSLLYHAAKQRFKELSQLLIQYGATIDLDSAILLGQKDLISLELSSNDQLLHRSIELEHEEIALWLIEQEVNLSILNPLNKSPLEMACEHGLTQVAIKIFGKFESVKQPISVIVQGCKKNPLFIAVQKSNNALVTFFLNKGIDPNIIEPSLGRTCLYQAVMNENEEIARLLLAAGADIGIRDKSGYLPLHRAAVHGNHGIISLLLKAYLEAKTRDGKTPYDLLPKGITSQTADLLIFAKSSIFFPILCPQITPNIFSNIIRPLWEEEQTTWKKATASIPFVSHSWYQWWKKESTNHTQTSTFYENDKAVASIMRMTK